MTRPAKYHALQLCLINNVFFKEPDSMISSPRFRFGIAATALSLLWTAAPVQAQPPARRQPTPNDTLRSPEVGPDHRVTFRIYAPKADEVTLSGDWIAQGLGTGGKLTKDDQGVWSITVGPLVPDYYSYSFNVDGVRTVDPKNGKVKEGISSTESMVEVPGEEAAFQAVRAVPHGEIRIALYHSGTLGSTRSMHVYTPPGYDQGDAKYPVFYLLHGGGDNDTGWSTIGRAGYIMDNLLADKKARPMIVVMPNGSLPMPPNMPRFTPGTTPTPEFMAAMDAAQDRFRNELLKEVVPFVEKNYRVLTGQVNRALAGLSMGGGQTLRVLTHNPDQFAYVGVWSAGVRRIEDFEKRNADFLNNPDKVNRLVKVLSISVGEKDNLAFQGSKALADLLNKRGIKTELNTSAGGHTWINWRHYLSEFAPRLFP
jgi:enterochelin esterase family protein